MICLDGSEQCCRPVHFCRRVSAFSWWQKKREIWLLEAAIFCCAEWVGKVWQPQWNFSCSKSSLVTKGCVQLGLCVQGEIKKTEDTFFQTKSAKSCLFRRTACPNPKKLSEIRFLLVPAELKLLELFSSFCQNMTPRFWASVGYLPCSVCISTLKSDHGKFVSVAEDLFQC